MKKNLFLFFILIVPAFTFSYAQNPIVQNQEDNAVNSEMPGVVQHSSKADVELKYINLPPGTHIGNTNYTGNYYCSGCISFTENQMTSFVGGKLHTIKVFMPRESYMPNLVPNMSKVWIKSTLSGAVLYEQPFIPVLNQYNDIQLTTPYEIKTGSLVFGYTVYLDNLQGVEMRAWAASTKDDPYQPGGFHYQRNNDPNNYGQGATWLNYTTAGNIAIIGLVSSVELPEKDLSATGLTSPNFLSDFFYVDQEITYDVHVSNKGKSCALYL